MTGTNGSNGGSNGGATVGTTRVKQGLAQMLKGGVIVSSNEESFFLFAKKQGKQTCSCHDASLHKAELRKGNEKMTKKKTKMFLKVIQI